MCLQYLYVLSGALLHYSYVIPSHLKENYLFSSLVFMWCTVLCKNIELCISRGLGYRYGDEFEYVCRDGLRSVSVIQKANNWIRFGFVEFMYILITNNRISLQTNKQRMKLEVRQKWRGTELDRNEHQQMTSEKFSK